MTEPEKTELTDSQKLSTLKTISTVPLITIRTAFPFRLFPCVLTLDREKLTISDHFFFNAKQVENLLAKDVVSVTSTENWLFASMTFVSGVKLNKEFRVSYLWKEDAQRLRRIMQGLVIASREGVDLMQIPDHELVVKLEQIGTSHM